MTWRTNSNDATQKGNKTATAPESNQDAAHINSTDNTTQRNNVATKNKRQQQKNNDNATQKENNTETTLDSNSDAIQIHSSDDTTQQNINAA